MDKKAQVSIAAVILVLLVMLIVFVTIIVVLLKPEVLNFTKTNENPQVTGEVVNVLKCNSPYIQVGNECCLDSNYNGICDRDEQYTKPVALSTPTPITQSNYRNCIPPYVNYGGMCCLDQDSNGICDMMEDPNSDYYGSNYGSSYARIRNSDIDSPFDISSVDATRREIGFYLKNSGSVDVVVTKIRIDDCDTYNPDKAIASGNKKYFNLDCDFSSTTDDQITVEYTNGGNSTQTATGNIRVDFRNY